MKVRGGEADADREARPSADLSQEDRQAISDRSSGSAKVVHEVVRLQGDEELGRPIQSLLFSGLAAGVAISTSLLAEAFLQMRVRGNAASGHRRTLMTIHLNASDVVRLCAQSGRQKNSTGRRRVS
jgi:hypothetical protein